MKASIFIKTALIDQMQIIADAGLWFHLAKLIPSGVEVLARVRYASKHVYGEVESNNSAGYVGIYSNGVIEYPLYVSDYVNKLYEELFPIKYRELGAASVSKEFFSVKPLVWLTSSDGGEKTHLQVIGEPEPMRAQSFYIHVPIWFEDFKTACKAVLAKIESGEVSDIDVFKTIEPK